VPLNLGSRTLSVQIGKWGELGLVEPTEPGCSLLGAPGSGREAEKGDAALAGGRGPNELELEHERKRPNRAEINGIDEFTTRLSGVLGAGCNEESKVFADVAHGHSPALGQARKLDPTPACSAQFGTSAARLCFERGDRPLALG
jgi:hypothetical protein